MRRAMVGLVAAVGLLLASCAPIPEGAVEAEALACPPDEEGCDPIQPVGPGGELVVEGGNFWFDVVEGVPITGEIEVTLVNVSDAFHNFEVLGAADGSEIIEANANEEGTGVVNLFPGQWTVICNVPGHREAGMEFRMTVYADEEEAAEAEEAGELLTDYSQREYPMGPPEL